MNDMRTHVLYLFFLCLFVFLFSSCNNKKVRYRALLTEIDSLLVSQPDSAYKSLSAINEKILSQQEQIYFNLLYTIASDKMTYDLTDDYRISTTTAESSFRKEPYNKFRANLYYGLVKLRIDKYDSLGYYHLLTANDICNRNIIPDDSYKRLLYWYIADYNKTYKDYSKAEEYFIKAKDISGAENITFICQCDIALFWIYVAKQEEDKMAETVERYFEDESIPNSSLLSIYNVRTMYYYYTSDYIKSIEHGKKEAELWKSEGLRVKVYYTIADSYYKLNRLDSAIRYMHLSIDNNRGPFPSENSELYFNYSKMLGKLYAEKGDINNSHRYYEEALKYHNDLIEISSNNIMDNIEKELEIEERDKEIAQMESKQALIGTVIIIILLLFIITFLLLRNSVLKQKRIAHYNELKRIESEIWRSIMDVKTGQFDDLYNYMSKELKKRENEKILELLNDWVGSIKTQNKRNYSEKLKSEDFKSYFPLLIKINKLSVLEKMTLILLKMNLSSDYISKIIYSNMDNMRGPKSRLKEKINESEALSYNEKNYLLSLVDLL